MDNASKALLIVGEILIAMLIVGLIASVVSKFGAFSANMSNKMEKNKQEDFNNHFFTFEGRIDITAAEIIGIANYAKENNDNSELFLKNGHTANSSGVDYVDVSVDGSSLFNVNSETAYINKTRDFLKNNNENYFSCNAEIIGIEDNNIIKKIKDNNQIEMVNKDNGRKGYVKSIKFVVTESHKLEIETGSKYLTIYNIDRFTINS